MGEGSQSPSRTRTASTCTPHAARGTHTFKITGYSLLKGLGAGKFIRSTAFDVGGYQWCIRFYPDGDGSGKHTDHVQAYLELMTKRAEVRESPLRLQAGGPRHRQLHADAPRRDTDGGVQKRLVVGGQKQLRNGYVHFDDEEGARDVVLPVERLPHHRLQCHRDHQGASRTEHEQAAGASGSAAAGPVEQSAEIAGGEERNGRYVHGERRDVLRAQDPPRDAVARVRRRVLRAVFEDVETDAFGALLHFVYTDSLPPAAVEAAAGSSHDGPDEQRMEMVMRVLVAAGKYGMERLKLMCQDILCKSLDVRNVTTILALAELHRCIGLRDACAEFIASTRRSKGACTCEKDARL
ncbi:hypothetical protein PR202_gb17830 [Eleusine coracana subsp. coracana]|uniref:MATH domain-containing protein n=1 Tax=Eleusine coracana subsp. coracana TaxID=191504 RepID=A0AAV5F437_ELECO|nr:hypothetical protein PR202_gb17830 [Eleusine coracana subsp. coracana]